MDANGKCFVPDEHVLSGIFPNIPDISEKCPEVICNSIEVCNFRLTFDVEPRLGLPTDLIIRLETAKDKLKAVARMQGLARRQAPNIVLETLEVGTVDDVQGRQLGYSITPFLAGTVCLEEIWNEMEESNQRALMDSVVDAMRKFHELRIQDFDSLYPEDSVISDDSNDSATPSKELFDSHKKGYHSNELFGSPDKGYHATIKPLLESYIGHNARPIGQIVYTADGVAIRSADNGAVEFTITDLEELGRNAVLCHNDIEPRNILVKQSPSSTNASRGGAWYELAAIIDWGMSGILNFAYEFGMKGAMLGSANLLFSWYELFKEKTADLVPRGEAPEKMIAALGVIGRCNARVVPGNVGGRFREKWFARERLERSPDVRRGWIRQKGAGDVPPFTTADQDDIETEVLKELGDM
ncbi:aminoglycoside phosphotransferase [Colletotrichum musicola]|uniref:Aminoglycoside phosphotransferase n=1 Tax=Colletotrichum musicola TaxID=2175873 RepID=A0A8H6JCG6_9PEZI|nr:aminoglycoside phosphotransferase [Colletotrichum musicola]